MLESKQQNQCGGDNIQAKHARVRQLSLQVQMLSNALDFSQAWTRSSFGNSYNETNG